MPSAVFPYHLQRHLNQIKRDINVVEQQVNALHNKNEAPKQKTNAKNTQNVPAPKIADKKQSKTMVQKKPIQKEKRTFDKENKEINQVHSGLKKDDSLMCMCCQSGQTCHGKVSTRKCSKNHLHYTIRIPVSAVTEPRSMHQLPAGEPPNTWRDVLLSNKEKPSARQDKAASIRPKTPRPDRQAVAAEVLEEAQREVRLAREEKAQAQMEATRAHMAVTKLQILLEAKSATSLSNRKCYESIERLIQEQLANEMRNVKDLVLEETVAQFNSLALLPSPSSGGASSHRFRASSPARSDHSSHSNSSWHDMSAIKTFNTI